MCLEAGPALGFDPPERVRVDGPGDAITWVRTAVPDFGWYPEVYVLFLWGDRGDEVLRRVAWLGPGATLDDFVAWPDFSLGYLPPGGADRLMLLICRPGPVWSRRPTTGRPMHCSAWPTKPAGYRWPTWS